jgi:hypothetical protein
MESRSQKSRHLGRVFEFPTRAELLALPLEEAVYLLVRCGVDRARALDYVQGRILAVKRPQPALGVDSGESWVGAYLRSAAPFKPSQRVS